MTLYLIQSHPTAQSAHSALPCDLMWCNVYFMCNAHIDHRVEAVQLRYTWEEFREMLHFTRCRQSRPQAGQALCCREWCLGVQGQHSTAENYSVKTMPFIL